VVGVEGVREGGRAHDSTQMNFRIVIELSEVHVRDGRTLSGIRVKKGGPRFNSNENLIIKWDEGAHEWKEEAPRST
jgi:hypothetical protein